MKRRILSLLLAVALLCTLLPQLTLAAAAAEVTGTCGENLTWSYDDTTHKLTVSGTGPMDGWFFENAPWKKYRGSVTTLEIEEGVTSIGKEAFYRFDKLTSVSIPNTVTSIGMCAFYECKSLTTIEIPASVESIGVNTFYWDDSLQAINVDPNNPSYSSIDGVLFNKDQTELIRYPGGRTGGYEIPDSVTYISKSAFAFCTGLTSIGIPEGVTRIGEFAFQVCEGLTELTLPSSLWYIGNRAFTGCDGLTSLVIPEGVTDIDMCAFEFCEGLTSVTIPASVTSLAVTAFNHSLNLASLEIAEDNPNYCSVDGVVFNKAQTALYSCICGKTGSYSIPQGVTNIASRAFQYCGKLTAIEIPDSATSIGEYAFSDCDSLVELELPYGLTCVSRSMCSDCPSLVSVTIPNSVTYIDEYAFASCHSLSQLTIPDSVTAIGNDAFSCCYSLTSVTLPESVTSVGDYAFGSCSSLTEVTILNPECSIYDYAYNFYNPNSTTIYGHDNSTAQAYAEQYGYTFVSIDPVPNTVSGECGEDLIWVLDLDTGAMTISGSGPMDNWSFNRAPWNSLRSQIVSVEIEDGVTSLGSCAFYQCDNFETISIPDSVTSMGMCSLYECTKLTEVNIPASVTSIGVNAFYLSDAMTDINVAPDNPSYSSIDGVLFNKDQTELIRYPAGRVGGYQIPDGVTSIGYSAFGICEGLTAVEFPEGLTNIENFAFQECHGLTEVSFPDSLYAIDERAFSGCRGLRELTLPEDLSFIGTCAFESCMGLTTVTLPAHVVTLGGSVFFYCQNMTEINVDEDNQCFCSDDGVLFNKAKTTLIEFPCAKSGDYIAPESVERIGVRAFQSCENVTSVALPASVNYIGDTAFCSCYSLETVNIPDGVKKIDHNTFYLCKALTSVTVPASVTSIGQYAFDGCNQMESATILNPECTIFRSRYTLGSVKNTTIYGYYDSTAEDYAEEYGFTFVPLDEPTNTVSGECGENVTWVLDLDTGALRITGTGPMDNWTDYTAPWSQYRYMITSVTIKKGVTTVGNQAFYECYELKKVSIPEGVTSIGFCSLYGCPKLTSVKIPASVEEIGVNAFYWSTGLEEITVAPDNQYFTSVDGVLFNKDQTLLIRYPLAKAGDYQVPEGVQRIEHAAFSFCSDLTAISFPETLTAFGDFAFQGCNGLTEVTIPSSITWIANRAFTDCKGLTSVSIPDTVRSIDICAFEFCDSLTSVTIPDSVTSLAGTAFLGCASLQEIVIGEENPRYCSVDGVVFDKTMTYLIAYPAGKAGSYEVPDGVVYIVERAFEDCKKLTSVDIPESVTSIGQYGLEGCDNLVSVTIRNPECSIYQWLNTLSYSWKTTVYGYSGSTAEAYAARYGFTFVPLDEPARYQVHFDANGGEGTMADQAIAYDTNANLTANAFSRTGYSFNGWNTAADGSGTSHGDGASVYNLTSETEITLYAQWKAKTYTVRYHANGGEGAALENQRATYDAPFVLRENTFTRTGYTAAGWNTAADGSGTAYESGQPAANLTDAAAITLYAQYVPNTYAIVFNANGGEGEMAAQQMTYGVYSALTQNAFTRTGFTFDGWNTARDGSGTAYPDKRTVRNLATEGSVTLYAQWKPNNYTILLVANGGEGDTVTVRATYNLPVALPANTFTRTAYKFAGWNTAADGSGTPFTDRQTVRNLASGGTVKLYAQWKPNAYTIMFVTNGGSGSTVSQKTFYDLPTALEPNTFTKTGYSFAKWNTAYDGSGTSYSDGQTVKNLAQSGTFKLYAQWKANKYTVTFDANGGTGTMVDQTMTYNTSAALRLNTYTKTGYTFTGWNTAADGSGTAYANGKTVRNLAAEGTVTLYAQWTPNTITVRFYPNGGVGSMDNQVMTYDVPAALNANNFSKDGYTFAGWKTGAGATYTDGQVVENLALKGVVNLYAQWTR